MDNDTLEFIQILKVNDVELWDFKDHHSHLISKSPLEVFFNKDMGVSILKLHNFQYALDRTLKIIGSSNDKQLPSYLLPHVGGCYLLKLGNSSSDPAVANLDTIFQKSCQFIRNPDFETQLHEYSQKNVIAKGGSFVKDAFIAGTSLVSKGVDAIIHKTQKINPNQTTIRKIEEIRMVDKDQSSFETFKRKDVIDLLENSNEYSKRQDEGFWNKFGKEESDLTLTEKIEKTLEPIAQEKTRLRKLSEKGQELVEKAKESISNLRTKITGHVEVKEEDKILLREDHFTDIGQMEYLPIDKPTALTKATEKASDLVEKAVETAVETVSDIASKITGTSEDVKEEVAEKEEGIKEKVTPVEGESKPAVEQAKETVKEFTRKVSEKLEDYRDSGDLSSDTTIQPNREGPSVLDKVNDEYAKVADKVVEKVEGAAETVAEAATGSEEKGKAVVESAKEGVQNISRKLSGSAENIQEEGAGEFKQVKPGFSDTVQEQEGQINKQLQSDNPFESLVSGGQLKPNIAGGAEKTKEGLTSVSNQMTEKATEMKEKIKSTFIPTDKENAPQSTV